MQQLPQWSYCAVNRSSHRAARPTQWNIFPASSCHEVVCLEPLLSGKEPDTSRVVHTFATDCTAISNYRLSLIATNMLPFISVSVFQALQSNGNTVQFTFHSVGKKVIFIHAFRIENCWRKLD